MVQALAAARSARLRDRGAVPARDGSRWSRPPRAMLGSAAVILRDGGPIFGFGGAVLARELTAAKNWQRDRRANRAKVGARIGQIVEADRLQADQAREADVGVKGGARHMDAAGGRLCATVPRRCQAGDRSIRPASWRAGQNPLRGDRRASDGQAAIGACANQRGDAVARQGDGFIERFTLALRARECGADTLRGGLVLQPLRCTNAHQL